MSIGSINRDLMTAVEGRSDYSETGRNTTKAAGFELVLERTGGKSASELISRKLVAAQAEFLRLQMMRDAISLGSDESQSRSFTSNNNITAQFVQGLDTYRKIDDSGKSKDSSAPDDSAVAVQPEEPVLSAASGNSGAGTGALEDIIQRASSRFGVEPGLIRAVIKAESNFNPNAVSGAGARGLMQLMPGTARYLGVTNSFDPEQNVMAGTHYLRKMLDRYDGDLDSALAAYNWGPGNVDRKGWSLPRETRSYLARVKNLYNSYSG